MGSAAFTAGDLSFVSARKRKRLLAWLSESKAPAWMFRTLASGAGMTHKEATRLLFLADRRKIGRLYLVHYHVTHPEDAILRSPYYEGLPSFPFECPECGIAVTGVEDLESELMLALPGFGMASESDNG